MTSPAMIEIEALSKTYVMGEETVTALDSVDLTITRGESLAIVGPSRGRYRFEGEDVGAFPMTSWRTSGTVELALSSSLSSSCPGSPLSRMSSYR